MKSLMKYKNTIIALTVLVVAFWAYNAFLSDIFVGISEVGSSEEVGRDLVEVYNKLQAVNFDTDLFESESYRNLVDLGSELGALPVGRSNPFDIIGRD